jgi:hypothetical protein
MTFGNILSHLLLESHLSSEDTETIEAFALSSLPYLGPGGLSSLSLSPPLRFCTKKESDRETRPVPRRRP